MHTRDDFIGAVKIKDGLFMGDEYAAGDFELLSNNKITHIVNCAGRELLNHWESMGVAYLTLTWQETDYQVLFEGKFDVVTNLYRFIENALNKGESVLIHSSKGQNRCCCAVAVYCMKKYRWTLYKTLEFLQSRRPKMTIRPNFFSQLVNLENKLTRTGQGARTFNWNEIGDGANNIESDELLVTNTFINSKATPHADFNIFIPKEYKPSKLMWVDQQQTPTPGPKPSLTSVLGKPKVKSHEPGAPKPEPAIQEIEGKSYVKSILKGSEKLFCITPQEKPNRPESSNRKYSTGEVRASAGVHIHGRKGVTKLRPGSANVPNGKPLMTKSSSSPMFEKIGQQDGKGQKIQGNIIHITVNNYITNERPSSSKGLQNKTESPLYIDNKKTAFSANNSHLDLISVPSKSASLHNSMSHDKNLQDPRNLFQKEDNALSLSLNSKSNDYGQDLMSASGSSLGIFGTKSIKYEGPTNEKDHPKVRKIAQPMKAFKLEETRFASASKATAVYDPSTGTIKYLSNGKTPPVRATNDMDPLKIFANYNSESKKEAARPVTAPTRTAKKRQDSPYAHPDSFMSTNDNSRENKNSNSNIRSGSLQPRKDEPKIRQQMSQWKQAIYPVFPKQRSNSR